MIDSSLLCSDNMIARESDDESYSASGWVACVNGEKAEMSAFSHCSCYDTWDGLGASWTGTVDEMLSMAKEELCPVMPSRKLNSDDYDYNYVIGLYKQIIEWDKNGRPVKGSA